LPEKFRFFFNGRVRRDVPYRMQCLVEVDLMYCYRYTAATGGYFRPAMVPNAKFGLFFSMSGHCVDTIDPNVFSVTFGTHSTEVCGNQ